MDDNMVGRNHATKRTDDMNKNEIAKIMETRLTGVIVTQPATITHTKTGGQFVGDIVADFSNLTVGDAVRRAMSNIVIATAPNVRANITKFRSVTEIKIAAPRPGKRERATAITTVDDVVSFLAGKSASEIALIMDTVKSKSA